MTSGPHPESHPGPACPSDEDRRYRTHRSVCRLLEVLGGGPPLVLLLDDLHWADSGSVELLCALLRRPPAGPVLLATALRPRQAAPRLVGALHRAADTGLLTRIELAGLTLDDARRLLGSDIDEGLVPSLHAESGGNPFYLRQLAQFRPRDGAVTAGTPLDVGVPTAVAAALGDELATLDGATRRALEAAAVAGDPFLLEVAAAAAALPETAMADALDELQRRDLVRPTEAPRRFRFRHPLVRRAVYGSAPAGWRLGAHERCTQALADRGVTVAGRAHHVIQAARAGDLAAVGLLRDAGKAVVGRAPGEAAEREVMRLGRPPAGRRVMLLGPVLSSETSSCSSCPTGIPRRPDCCADRTGARENRPRHQCMGATDALPCGR
ncbi:AAA family ATPase [Pseudonocardia charpentierae]|uniref:AAA family ATPase n=1 Tax=Pseudonocardia charpentierae TaxID=3075545 RepID=A0ABU2NHL0_9PSEU|nr:AAA family ATPase [Pseudonocardia sp. DSM 45834]MDT0353456.1 AAA family ATPase [Pseudonocardia sp. DSM 45834]